MAIIDKSFGDISGGVVNVYSIYGVDINYYRKLTCIIYIGESDVLVLMESGINRFERYNNRGVKKKGAFENA